MLIAIDYDDTFTLDKEGWFETIVNMGRRGHRFVVATSRRDTYENRLEACAQFPAGVQAICCSHNAKAEHLKKLGIVPDVWIDDNPWSIVGEDKP